MALGVLALLIAFTAAAFLMREPNPLTVTFDHYEKSGLSNYALLRITNQSARTFRFTTFNTSPEGTVKHFAMINGTHGWNQLQEFKPQQAGTLYSFVNTIEPRRAELVRGPVDELTRKVAIPFYAERHDSAPNLESYLLRLRLAFQRLLRQAPDTARLITCPTELRVSKPPK
jgi:hypothetical protein